MLFNTRVLLATLVHFATARINSAGKTKNSDCITNLETLNNQVTEVLNGEQPFAENIHRIINTLILIKTQTTRRWLGAASAEENGRLKKSLEYLHGIALDDIEAKITIDETKITQPELLKALKANALPESAFAKATNTVTSTATKLTSERAKTVYRELHAYLNYNYTDESEQKELVLNLIYNTLIELEKDVTYRELSAAKSSKARIYLWGKIQGLLQSKIEVISATEDPTEFGCLTLASQTANSFLHPTTESTAAGGAGSETAIMATPSLTQIAITHPQLLNIFKLAKYKIDEEFESSPQTETLIQLIYLTLANLEAELKESKANITDGEVWFRLAFILSASYAKETVKKITGQSINDDSSSEDSASLDSMETGSVTGSVATSPSKALTKASRPSMRSSLSMIGSRRSLIGTGSAAGAGSATPPRMTAVIEDGETILAMKVQLAEAEAARVAAEKAHETARSELATARSAVALTPVRTTDSGDTTTDLHALREKSTKIIGLPPMSDKEYDNLMDAIDTQSNDTDKNQLRIYLSLQPIHIINGIVNKLKARLPLAAITRLEYTIPGTDPEEKEKFIQKIKINPKNYDGVLKFVKSKPELKIKLVELLNKCETPEEGDKLFELLNTALTKLIDGYELKADLSSELYTMFADDSISTDAILKTYREKKPPEEKKTNLTAKAKAAPTTEAAAVDPSKARAAGLGSAAADKDLKLDKITDTLSRLELIHPAGSGSHPSPDALAKISAPLNEYADTLRLALQNSLLTDLSDKKAKPGNDTVIKEAITTIKEIEKLAKLDFLQKWLALGNGELHVEKLKTGLKTGTNLKVYIGSHLKILQRYLAGANQKIEAVDNFLAWASEKTGATAVLNHFASNGLLIKLLQVAPIADKSALPKELQEALATLDTNLAKESAGITAQEMVNSIHDRMQQINTQLAAIKALPNRTEELRAQFTGKAVLLTANAANLEKQLQLLDPTMAIPKEIKRLKRIAELHDRIAALKPGSHHREASALVDPAPKPEVAVAISDSTQASGAKTPTSTLGHGGAGRPAAAPPPPMGGRAGFLAAITARKVDTASNDGDTRTAAPPAAPPRPPMPGLGGPAFLASIRARGDAAALNTATAVPPPPPPLPATESKLVASAALMGLMISKATGAPPPPPRPASGSDASDGETPPPPPPRPTAGSDASDDGFIPPPPKDAADSLLATVTLAPGSSAPEPATAAAPPPTSFANLLVSVQRTEPSATGATAGAGGAATKPDPTTFAANATKTATETEDPRAKLMTMLAKRRTG